MFDTSEKKERALGVRLFLKADRCNSPKCVGVRNPSPPGVHGKARRRAKSEFGEQTLERQRIKATYGLREAAMRQVFKKASKNPGVTGQMLISFLERRLDNVVYRLGLATSRSVARQLVSHGHIFVNGRRVSIPSCALRVNDVVSIRPLSRENPAFKNLAESIKKYEPPVWLSLDKDKLEGKMTSLPEDLDFPFNVSKVVDYYARIS